MIKFLNLQEILIELGSNRTIMKTSNRALLNMYNREIDPLELYSPTTGKSVNYEFTSLLHVLQMNTSKWICISDVNVLNHAQADIKEEFRQAGKIIQEGDKNLKSLLQDLPALASSVISVYHSSHLDKMLALQQRALDLGLLTKDLM
jgi:hypothetical protein